MTSRWPQKLDQLYCDELVSCAAVAIAAAASLSHITEKNNEKQFDSHVSNEQNPSSKNDAIEF